MPGFEGFIFTSCISSWGYRNSPVHVFVCICQVGLQWRLSARFRVMSIKARLTSINQKSLQCMSHFGGIFSEVTQWRLIFTNMNPFCLLGRVSLFSITNFCKRHQQMCWSLLKYFRSHVPFQVEQHPNAETIIDIDWKSCLVLSDNFVTCHFAENSLIFFKSYSKRTTLK